MTKKQMKLIKDLILFSKPITEEYRQAYSYVVSELYEEIKLKGYKYSPKETNRGSKNDNDK